MKTALEAFFDAMVSNGWADEQDGDVQTFHHFALFGTITPDEVDSMAEEFSSVLDTYGRPNNDEVVGHFLVITGSEGHVTVLQYETELEAVHAFGTHQHAYSELHNAQGR